MKKKIFRIFANIVFGIRKFNNDKIREFAKNVNNKIVLEIGSGKHDHGENHYSALKYFNDSNTLIPSDVNPDFGYKVIDITKMTDENKYDIILCLNVLEHVFEYQIALANLKRALKQDGLLVILVPVFYPLHDEPHDYWRFTEHSLRKICSDFTVKSFDYKGVREFTTAYFMVLQKTS
jgi:SAM-dependent methyltransferase